MSTSFSTSSKSGEMMIQSRSAKVGRNGQKPIDVFFSTSNSDEMSLQLEQQITSDDYVERNFQCVKCGAMNENVSCLHGVMKCVVCGNNKKNLENPEYFAEHSPDYLEQCLDTDDKIFNFKEFLKQNTIRHSERLGSAEVDVDRTRPCDWDLQTIIPCTREQVEIEQYLVPTKKLRGNKARIRDHVTDAILSEVAYQRPDPKEPVEWNVLKRNVRIVNELQNEVTKVSYKPVQINSWKKILRENSHLTSMLAYKFDPENPPLSPRALGNWTWSFRSLVKDEEKLKAFARIIPNVPEALYSVMKVDGKEMIVFEDPDRKGKEKMTYRRFDFGYDPMAKFYMDILMQEAMLPAQ